jgi:hypothetical protein
MENAEMELKLLAAGMVFALAAGQVKAQTFESAVDLSFDRAPFLGADVDKRLSDSSRRLSGCAGKAIDNLNVRNRDIGSKDFSSHAPKGRTRLDNQPSQRHIASAHSQMMTITDNTKDSGSDLLSGAGT